MYRIIVLVLFLSVRSNAQSIYAETFGNTASFYSVNYEHSVKNSKSYHWNVHGGIGFYKAQGYFLKTIPAGINWFNRKDGNHHNEFGLSITYSENVLNDYLNGSMLASEYKKHEYLYMIFNAGYRYQKPEGGFIFKIYWAPGFPLKEFTQPVPDRKMFYVKNVGVAFGYGFKKRSN